jgi:transcriptional regulator with XRE-family HTH domain
MSGQVSSSVAKYFGAQLAKERKRAKLSMLALSKITGIDNGHLGRIERGERSPTANIARCLDDAFFPDGEGAKFLELYEASRSWVPAAFRAWSEYEEQATQYTDRVLATLSAKFDTLRADCYRRGESLSIMRHLEAIWRRGASPLTAVLTVESA